VRPTTIVPGGIDATGRVNRRWKFMRPPHETGDAMNEAAKVWALLSAWIKPDQGERVRHRVHIFRSLVAVRFRDGRVFLAGDAVHVMAPFMGQGMCDVWNLAGELGPQWRGALWGQDRVLCRWALPCGLTDWPWDGHCFGRGRDPATGFTWTCPFFWGASQSVDSHAALWDQLETNKKVGVPWSNDSDGVPLSNKDHGPPPLFAAKGYELVDAGFHQPLADDVSARIAQLKANTVTKAVHRGAAVLEHRPGQERLPDASGRRSMDCAGRWQGRHHRLRKPIRRRNPGSGALQGTGAKRGTGRSPRRLALHHIRLDQDARGLLQMIPRRLDHGGCGRDPGQGAGGRCCRRSDPEKSSASV
jgi:hypothetical protein